MEEQIVELIEDPRSEENRNAQHRNQHFLWGLVIGVAVVMIVVSQIPRIKAPAVVSYKNKKYGFQLKYPNHWRMIENPGNLNLSPVVFVAPGFLPLEKVPTTFAVIYKPITQGTTSLERLTHDSIQSFLKDAAQDIRVLDSRPVRIGGRPAYRFSFELYDKKPAMKFLLFWMLDLKNNSIVDLTYTSSQGNFDKHLSDAETMVQSFRFGK